MTDCVVREPMASIVLLTCNRKAMVAELLHDFPRQTVFEDVEIIVVDNGSEDGTVDLIEKNFPDVVLLQMQSNLGCAGRNYGIRRASADIVITLDDDVFFHRDDELERILEFFSEDPQASAVNFKILFPHNKKLIPFNWFHPRDPDSFQNATFETDYISEGAVAFRKEIFKQVGDYPESFFISHEGPDLALRMIGAGKIIKYSGNIEVLHKCSLEQRTTWRNTYYDTRNYFWLLYRNWPISFFLPKSIFRLATTLVFALSRGQLLWYFRAVRDALLGLPRQHKERHPLGRKARKHLQEIRKYLPSFVVRLKNFFTKIRFQNRQY